MSPEARRRKISSKLATEISIEIAPGLDGLAATWRELAARSVVSPYQAFDLVAAWSRHASAEFGIEPRPGVVRDAGGTVVMILPFGLVRRGPLRRAVYLGGSHSNLNLPLVARDFAASLDEEQMRAILDGYCRQAGADLVALEHQPLAWGGDAHPFAALPRTASPDRVPRVMFGGTFEDFLHRQLSRSSRQKMRSRRSSLAKAGALSLWEAEEPAAVAAVLAAFAAQKSARLAAMGVSTPFTPGVLRALEAAALASARRQDGFKLYALSLDGEILATSGGIRQGQEFSWMISSFEATHPQARLSPGMVLLAWSLERCCADGVRSYDFGAGDEGYKDFWCNDVVVLFDSLHAATMRGRLACTALGLRTGLVRAIKGRPALFRALKTCRARLRGRPA